MRRARDEAPSEATIFGVSSGAPPAAIAIFRISGPGAEPALRALGGRLPPPREARARTLRAGGEPLDQAIVLWLPGPHTATGEDIAELHCHGGRAVVAAIGRALAALPGLRPAAPGEFTRRAFANGRIDLAEAEGLADLLSAETELQRRAALAAAGGAVSRETMRWRDAVLAASAEVEAALDFAEDDDVALAPDFVPRLRALCAEIAAWLRRPRAEALREGVRVVIAGPPNAGKSTLFNALVGEEAAIATPIAGTTRDSLLRNVALDGVAFTFVDTAGLRAQAEDPIEAIGIERAEAALARADIVLWLGAEGAGPDGAWEVAARADAADAIAKAAPRHTVSAATAEGMAALRADLVETARALLPRPGDAALNARQYGLLEEAAAALGEAAGEAELLLVAEGLRRARVAFDTLLGRAATEDMLDALFGRFCLGK